MPIRLSALTADRRTITVPFGDDTLTLTYKPSAINAVQEARELEERAAGKHLMSQAKSLAEAIASWDVVGDDGAPLTVSVEVLAALGLDVTSKVSRAMIEDLLPNRTPAAASPNGSSAAGSSASAQTGTPTS